MINFKEIEEKWRTYWEEINLYKVSDDFKPNQKKFYILDMFPYPSGEGLHVGHPKGYIATDIYSRYKKMSGFNVLHPMGFDAFGLPAEQYALKNKVNPAISTENNIKRFKEQLKNISINYDWSKEINTSDSEFYKWTQWMFKEMYKAGLVYESNEPINWCPSCKTGLANEDLDGNLCERCSTLTEKKPLRQWIIKITDYADRLLEDIEDLDWESHIKELQKNWIGKSQGSEITFEIISKEKNYKNNFNIFTTRADTLFGCTYCVLSPENKLINEFLEKDLIKNKNEVKSYIDLCKTKTDIERSADGKEKTGVVLEGVFAINPVNQKELPVYIADYVLNNYGTGAIMAVPAHDERDYEFAKKYNIEILEVIKSENAYKEGILINSEKFNDMNSEEARKKITDEVQGEIVTKYKLRDWVFARQRYWGEPFPIIFDENKKSFLVADKELPIILPMIENYEPTGTGESPLVNIKDWVEVYGYINQENEFESLSLNENQKKEIDEKKEIILENKIIKKYFRETNTMPGWAGSSWYYLRYIDPKNDNTFCEKSKEEKWSPVDFYVGGAEHATRHLIYARFWHKFLFDKGLVKNKEPFQKLQTVGLIMAEDGRKMSKRYGNTIDPNDIIEKYGADTLRIYEMFMGPFEKSIAWNTNSISGVERFLERVYAFSLICQNKNLENKIENLELEYILNITIKKVGEDIEDFRFNTSVSQMMICLNLLEEESKKGNFLSKENFEKFILILSPFAVHLAEEIWMNIFKKEKSIHLESWPNFDENKIIKTNIEMSLQISGKFRESFQIKNNAQDEEVKEVVKNLEAYKKYILDEKDIKKIIIVKNKIINIVI